jgi:hypothetical protein
LRVKGHVTSQSLEAAKYRYGAALLMIHRGHQSGRFLFSERDIFLTVKVRTTFCLKIETLLYKDMKESEVIILSDSIRYTVQ